MVDHPFDWDAATLEVCKSLRRAYHLIRVMDHQHRALGVTNGVRWTDEDMAALTRLEEAAHEKRSIYARFAANQTD